MMRAIAALFVRTSTSVSAPRDDDHPALERGLALAVICAGADAQALGAAVGLAATRGHGSCALVLTWVGRPCPPVQLVAPPRAAALRLAARLVARGVEARAAGRLVHASLPADEDRAATLARRATAAAGDATTVLVVGGPRTAALDDALAERDRVVVVTSPGSEPGIAELAGAAIPVPPPSVVSCTLSPGIAGRSLAAAGFGLVPSLRSALRPLTEAAT